jgi:hypothetical protein
MHGFKPNFGGGGSEFIYCNAFKWSTGPRSVEYILMNIIQFAVDEGITYVNIVIIFSLQYSHADSKIHVSDYSELRLH